jgi:hypothetical protein
MISFVSVGGRLYTRHDAEKAGATTVTGIYRSKLASGNDLS